LLVYKTSLARSLPGPTLPCAEGNLVEITGKKRDRSFAYQGYIDQLRIGTELGRTDR
jgi:hypothetical protein